MSDESLLEKAKQALHLATNYDLQQNFTEAIKHYLFGVDLLRKYLSKFLYQFIYLES